MRALIVDDHSLFSEGLRLLLAGSTSISDITCCESGPQAVELAAQTSFELVLLDWHLGVGLSGTALLSTLKEMLPHGRIVIVSGESSASCIRSAIEGGAAGFVPKESSPALLIDALTIIGHGGIYLPVAVLATTARTGSPPSSSAAGGDGATCLRSIREGFPRLTQRHADVLTRVARGMSNKQVARDLDISDGTVKQHLNAIFRELDVQSRTEAVYLLAKSGVTIG
ncbi:response regulator transcription factor [Rhizobacter sp. Root1221]|uniref:response regulator n=1 Tax=Rhizobacter sp. Root1221 TaxID=1736433 RepID=UPI0006FD4A90|nr:response regulator transcription factor [Rhizobacter sp. Root1221]KQW02826.1 hypothetical protein ASC87_00250 [Rhizobacter sp. Root1221]